MRLRVRSPGGRHFDVDLAAMDELPGMRQLRRTFQEGGDAQLLRFLQRHLGRGLDALHDAVSADLRSRLARITDLRTQLSTAVDSLLSGDGAAAATDVTGVVRALVREMDDLERVMADPDAHVVALFDALDHDTTRRAIQESSGGATTRPSRQRTNQDYHDAILTNPERRDRFVDPRTQPPTITGTSQRAQDALLLLQQNPTVVMERDPRTGVFVDADGRMTIVQARNGSLHVRGVEFDVRTHHGGIKGTHGILQSHHPAQDAHMLRLFGEFGYRSSDAPTMMLRNSHGSTAHGVITHAFQNPLSGARHGTASLANLRRWALLELAHVGAPDPKVQEWLGTFDQYFARSVLPDMLRRIDDPEAFATLIGDLPEATFRSMLDQLPDGNRPDPARVDALLAAMRRQ